MDFERGVDHSHGETRLPFKFRIFENATNGFAAGLLYGSAVYGVKGGLASPKGDRLVGGIKAVRLNALRLGCTFAAWSTVYTASESAMEFVRQKNDRLNPCVGVSAASAAVFSPKGLLTASKMAITAPVAYYILTAGFSILVAETSSSQKE